MTIAPIETNEQKLLKLQNALASESGQDIVDIRRAFNAANKDDAEYYVEEYNKLGRAVVFSGVVTLFTGFGTILTGAAGVLPLSLAFGAVAALGVVGCVGTLRAKDKISDAIEEKVAEAPEGPDAPQP